MKKTKQCPYCGEDILEAAIKCRYCGEFLEKQSEGSNKHEKEDEKNGKIDLKARRHM